MNLLVLCHSRPMTSAAFDVIRCSRDGDIAGLSRAIYLDGASPDAADLERRRTGLHHAAARGIDSVMAALLAAGADPNFRDLHGNAPLHLCGHAMTLELLLRYGADPALKNDNGMTPYEMMRRRGVGREIIQQLVDHEPSEEEAVEQSGENIVLRQRRPRIEFDESPEVNDSARQRLLDSPVDRAQSVHAFRMPCRRRRFVSRPISVFHEFFLSMDSKTLVVLVVCLLCLALFAAFYVTGVRLNYFSRSNEEESVELSEDDDAVKIVSIFV